MKYRLKYDLHTHTIFSHGKGTIEDNVIAAKEKGITSIGISDHGPGHLFYGIKREDVPVMREEIKKLNVKYPDMDIYLSVEANIINKSGILDIKPEEFSDYDYVIAGYHYGVAGDHPLSSFIRHGQNMVENRLGLDTKNLRKKNTDLVLQSLEKNDIKILAHPGDKAPVDLMKIAEACSQTDTLMELNTWHRSMDTEDLKAVSTTDVKFIISSDAHTPDRVGDFESAVELALDAGLDLKRIVNLETVDLEISEE